MQEPSSIQKIAEIDQHIGVAMSGLTADAKTLIDRARVETQVLVRRSLHCPALHLFIQVCFAQADVRNQATLVLSATSIQLWWANASWVMHPSSQWCGAFLWRGWWARRESHGNSCLRPCTLPESLYPQDHTGSLLLSCVEQPKTLDAAKEGQVAVLVAVMLDAGTIYWDTCMRNRLINLIMCTRRVDHLVWRCSWLVGIQMVQFCKPSSHPWHLNVYDNHDLSSTATLTYAIATPCIP